MKHVLIALAFLTTFSAYAAKSSENRANKSWEATVQLGLDYMTGTTQLMVSKFIDADNVIGLKGGHNKSGGDDDQQTSFALQYKHFTGNSFYVAGEVFYLNTLRDTNWIFFEDRSKYSSLGLGARIGNQWHYENFTIGCDWFGLGKRVVTFTKQNQDEIDITLTLLNLYLGWSF